MAGTTRDYGLRATSYEALVERLVTLFEMPLYRNESPMIGPWYSSEDPGPAMAAMAAMRAGEPVEMPAPPALSLALEITDPDPYFRSAEPPRGFVLRVTTDQERLHERVEKLLQNAQLIRVPD